VSLNCSLLILSALLLQGALAEEGGAPLPAPKTGDVAKRFTKPFSLYGRIIDQDGNAVANAEVVAGAGIVVDMGGMADVRQQQYKTTTNQEGDFALEEMQGFSFEMKSVSCPGYEVQQWPGVNYMDHPDQLQPNQISTRERPLILHAWKMRGADIIAALPLDSQKVQRISIKNDEKIVLFNFKTGRTVEETGRWDFGFKLGINQKAGTWATTAGIPEAIQKLPGAFQIIVTAREGGLIQVDAPLLYAAPDDGYTSPLVLDWTRGINSERMGTIFRLMYQDSRGGYGRFSFQVRLTGSQRPEAVRDRKPEDWTFGIQMLEAFHNPKGKNLEFEYVHSIRTWNDWINAGGEDER
jgi:hypothetical protein